MNLQRTHLDNLSFKLLWTLSRLNQIAAPKHEPQKKKINDDIQNLTPER